MTQRRRKKLALKVPYNISVPKVLARAMIHGVSRIAARFETRLVQSIYALSSEYPH